jgi:HEPN domain-containing protein
MKPSEEVKRELVKQWIFRADEDLKAAKVLLSQEGVAFSFVIGFHAQQAVENT